MVPGFMVHGLVVLRARTTRPVTIQCRVCRSTSTAFALWTGLPSALSCTTARLEVVVKWPTSSPP